MTTASTSRPCRLVAARTSDPAASLVRQKLQPCSTSIASSRSSDTFTVTLQGARTTRTAPARQIKIDELALGLTVSDDLPTPGTLDQPDGVGYLRKRSTAALSLPFRCTRP